MEKKVFLLIMGALVAAGITASGTAVVRTIENKTKLELFHEDIKEIKSDIKTLLRER